MSNDALERLKNRNRPKVQSRDTSLSSSLDIEISEHPDISISRYPDIQIPSNQDISNINTEEIPEEFKGEDKSISLEVEISGHPSIPISDSQEASLLESQQEDKVITSSDIQTSRYPDIQISGLSNQSFETKQTTLRLEREISEDLSNICKEGGFCREAFIEALIEYYQTHDEIREEILELARKRADLRLEVANQKRAKSMMKRFNS